MTILDNQVASDSFIDGNLPLTLLLLPLGSRYLGVHPYVLVQTIFGRKFLEVVLDLCTSSVDCRPIWLWLPRKDVVMRRYVARTAEIGFNQFNPMDDPDIAETHPGYLFSNQVPDISGFFS